MSTLRELRKQHGWSQGELAGKCGLARATISRIECGLLTTKDTLLRICQVVGVDIEDIANVRYSCQEVHEVLRKEDMQNK